MISVNTKVKERITKGLRKFQPILRKAQAADVNESDTVTIITDMLCEIFGYDKYENITSEFAIKKTYCDVAIKLDDNNLTDELSKFLTGFKMMYANLTEILNKFGVEEISRQGEKFDPTQEQALLVDTVDELEDDVVIEVLLKGYKLKDRVIRPASVKINQK